MSIVYVVEDDSAVRRSLRFTLDVFGYRVNDFGNGEEFLTVHPEPKPEPAALLLDIGLPGADGLTIQRHLNDEGWRPPIVMISGQAEISMAVNALQNGAFGFLEKPALPNELKAILESAFREDLSRIHARASRQRIRERIQLLSHREREVLQLTMQAKNAKQIAQEMYIGVKTVLRHKSNMLKKMKVGSDLELLTMVKSIDEEISV